MAKRYTVLNEKYGTVGEEITFSQLKKNAKANNADEDLTEDERGENNERAVVVDSHNVIVAEVDPDGDDNEGTVLSGGVTNRDEDKEQKI